MIAALKLDANGKFVSPDFIRSSVIARITQRETRDGPFAQLAYISFLFALRAPSEALPLRRAFKNDDLPAFSPMKGQAMLALMGARLTDVWF